MHESRDARHGLTFARGAQVIGIDFLTDRCLLVVERPIGGKLANDSANATEAPPCKMRIGWQLCEVTGIVPLR